MNYDDITIGQEVTVTTRGSRAAIVEKKFKSRSTLPGQPPVGTEYVSLRSPADDAWFINYPSQLEPRTDFRDD